ncbi:MAG: sensor histidine kinase [Ilumatobacteraceae bacterium]|nr:sensor histidine kinase [Ilumatobacteraceae bacterium]
MTDLAGASYSTPGRPNRGTFQRWRTQRQWAKAHSFGINAFVFSSFCLISIADVYFNGEGRGRSAGALAYILLIGQTLPLSYRLRYPLGSMYVVCASIGLYWSLDYPLGFDGAAVIAIYSAAAHGRGRRRTSRHVAVVTLVVSALAWSPWSTVEKTDPLIVAIGFVAVHVAAALLGEVVYQRRQRIIDLEQRASQAEENLELRADMAVAKERQRIAREMHDVVAHGISVISVQAAAAQEVARTDPDKTVQVLANIESVGRDSLTELRRMLGALRNDDNTPTSRSPQPGLADLAEAVAHSTAAGLPTELMITGTQRTLPAGIELTAYRIVQESLTNTRKHAGQSATADVHLCYSETGLTLEITDNGAGAMSKLATTGTGNGLVGMRERVEIYGGELSADPQPGGGFTVRATLPVDTSTRPSVVPATPSERNETA